MTVRLEVSGERGELSFGVEDLPLMDDELIQPPDRLGRPMSKVVGLYQSMLRRLLDHFFPDGRLLIDGDRSSIHWIMDPDRPNFQFDGDPDGLGVGIEWFGTRYQFLPGSPVPFLPTERRLVDSILKVLDARFRTMFELAAVDWTEMFHYAAEDLIVTQYLDPPSATRLPAALEALRVAALSTYEDRRVSSGALLLGTDSDPTQPERTNPEEAPRYNVRLTAIKSIHRLCDGLHTLFVVDRRGDLAWAVDIVRWAERVQGLAPLPAPCPRRFLHHARATLTGDHVCLVLTPSQEIKVFAGGTLAFVFSNAHWRLMDIPSKFEAWRRAVGETVPGLATRIFQAALNLCEARNGGLFVLLRDPESSMPQLVAPSDQMIKASASKTEAEPEPEPEPDEGDHLRPRMAKRALHHLVLGQDLTELDDRVLESLAGIEGAVVTDQDGRLLAFGAILRITPEAILAARAVEGARTVAALAASYHGPVLKISQDGVLSMYLGGRRVWDL
ncbi:hypothetical protein BH23PLA1_BH23PLA1_22760 [soil metagenome]